MTITVEGNYPKLQHVETGLHSLDHALAKGATLGMPLRVITEIYGNTHVGKSTLTYFLAGKVRPAGTILLCDFEGMDIEHLPVAMLPSGFDGTVKLIEAMDAKGKMKSHEDMLRELSVSYAEMPDINAGIIDSIGAIAPIFELEGGIEEGMGAKRATIVSRFIRRVLISVLGRDLPSNLFVTNHSHSLIMSQGHTSSGGVTLHGLSATRLYLYPKTADNIKSSDDVLAHCVGGTAEKLRYGGKGGQFKFFIIPGHGVRPNLTAIQDCVDLKLADRGSVLKIGDKSFGYISKAVQEDLDGNDDFFKPFFEALKAHG